VRARQELVDPRCWVTIGEAFERGGQPCVRVDVVEFAVFDQRGDHRPVVAAFVGAGEQGVLAIEGERTDGALDSVVVEIDATIVEEADQAVPAWERVADRLAEAALGADLPAACFEEPVQVVDDRPAALITDAAALDSK
jgi:hypothetical protein